MPMTAHRPILAVDDLRGRRALVLGFARSGVAAARFLADRGATVTAYDRRSAGELADAVEALEGRPVRPALGIPDEEAARLVAAADLIVTSPSISPRFATTDPFLRDALTVAADRGAEIVSEVELFLRLTPARILAVTGTKGKTTTAALLDAMLAAADLPHVLGGNIGTPLIEQGPGLTPAHWAVLELSELQLPTISRGGDIAVYPNILADHLDRHGSVEAYRAVKARLAELTASAGGLVVLNADDPVSRALGERLASRAVAWYAAASGPRTSAWVEGGWLVMGGERLIPAADVPLPGDHLRADVLAASLGAALAGASAPAIARAIAGFRGVPNRLEMVGDVRGVRYVNDSQATIPVAAIAALRAFGEARIVLIAGGKDKGLDYVELAGVIATHCRAAVLIGETAAALERLIAGRTPVHRATSMPDAVGTAASLAEAGDVVLLSPAAASFDMFVDYAARGEAFRAAVRTLDGGTRA
jgi:UDP-N-acetylmuramoylalanine--D-glutamate ligase